MTSTVFESTSVESAIKEAEKIGASPGEARRIHELVSANTSPEIVRGFELRFGRDASDNEALWVHLVVDSDLNPSPQKISRFSDLAKRVRSALLDANVRYWPYVDVRGRLGAPQ